MSAREISTMMKDGSNGFVIGLGDTNTGGWDTSDFNIADFMQLVIEYKELYEYKTRCSYDQIFITGRVTLLTVVTSVIWQRFPAVELGI